MEKYREHPRIIELKLAFLHNRFVNEFGLEKTTTIWQSICDIGRVNWTIISSVVNRKDSIFELKSLRPERFRQEVIFMGSLYGEGRVTVAKSYLGISKKTIFSHPSHDYAITSFLSQEWVESLDGSVKTLGIKQYAIEATRFLTFMDSLSGAIGNVPLAKI